MDRRQFIKTTAAISAGLYVANNATAQSNGKGNDRLKVALLGAGSQGLVLFDACQKLGKDSGLDFVAVCDIWEKHNLRRMAGRMRSFGKAYDWSFDYKKHAFTDYKEMLDTMTDLDAVIVATPDFWHAEHTIACLEKGLHVYCEKEMSNTIEGAKKMVDAQKKSGKLLQIGHQRRSNPRYRHCYEKLISEANMLGRITTINGQWNRSRAACVDLTWSEKTVIDDATLNKYGFKDMKQFRNWRWYKGLGGGPIVDLGSHQIDIYSWFLNTQPSSIIASGGVDYWTDHEWYDNVMAIYEYQTQQGPVRAFYQTLTTNSALGYYERFMGDQGTLEISEASARGSVYREGWVDESQWDQWVKKGYVTKAAGQPTKQEAAEDVVTDLRESVKPAEYNIPVEMNVPYHQPHLSNFFNSIRGKETLNCPAEDGFATAVTVLRVNDAVAKGAKIDFNPDEFKA